MDYTIKIGGAAGQGIQTIGALLSRAFSRSGFHIFAYQDYESRVRGGHNFFQIRFGDTRVLAPRDPVDVLVALDEDSIARHTGELSPWSSAIYDAASLKSEPQDSRYVDVPLVKLAEEHGGDKVMANSAASGAVMGMLGLDVELLVAVLPDTLGPGKEKLVEPNARVARAAHDYAVAQCPSCSFSLEPPGGKRMILEGNESVGLGAVAAGCRFYAAYPMTPSTGILNFMADHAQSLGLVVEQAEDEIAAINMMLGASFAGVRAMTGTSGGGFALMVEGVSLAGMTETPMVAVLAQRPGPATGLPTRTEQADLLYALYAGHGEFPRVLLAPGTPEQAYYLASKAFDLSEKYQVPAIILTDQHLADSQWTVNAFDLAQVPLKDYRLRGEQLEQLGEYHRHALTETGISPLAVPGDSRHLVVTDSDEHDEDGHIIEDAETRRKMVEKRWARKLPALTAEMSPPLHYGTAEPDLALVCWGSNYGVVKEAVDVLKSEGRAGAAMLHFSEIFPLPAGGKRSFLDTLRNARLTICIENNASGRFERLLRAETGFECDDSIRKYDGRPFSLEGFLEEIDGHLGRL